MMNFTVNSKRENQVVANNERFCKRCIYNIYKDGATDNSYPCGKKVCTPILESAESRNEYDSQDEIFNSHPEEVKVDSKRIIIEQPVDMGNGYIHTSRPISVDKKISQENIVKKVSQREAIRMDERNEIAAVSEVKKAVPQSQKVAVSGKPKAVGVDVGTAFIVSAKYNDQQQIECISVRDGFYKMEGSKQKKNMLHSSNVNYISIGEDLFVVGNEAFDMAVLFEQKLRRPMKSGVLSAEEKECEPVVMELLRQVAGQGGSNDIAYYSVPANPVDQGFDIIYHEAMFKSFFQKLGYNPDMVFPINEAMAIVNSELADTMFTGLAISFGAGMTNIAMAYRGMEIFSFSVARGGDWIDNEVAQNRQISLSDATATKENPDLDLMDPKDAIEDAIRIFYTAHLEYVVKNIMKSLELHKRKIKLKDKLKVVLSGGTSKPKGFLELFSQIVNKNPWNIAVGEVVHASNPLDAVARGCLIAAQRDLLDNQEG